MFKLRHVTRANRSACARPIGSHSPAPNLLTTIATTITATNHLKPAICPKIAAYLSSKFLNLSPKPTFVPLFRLKFSKQPTIKTPIFLQHPILAFLKNSSKRLRVS